MIASCLTSSEHRKVVYAQLSISMQRINKRPPTLAIPTQRLQPKLQLRSRININLPMLTHSHDRPVVLPLHHTPQGSHLCPDLQDVTLNQDLGADRGWTEIGGVQRPGYPQILPEPGLGHKGGGGGGAKVKEGCRAASVEVVEAVAVLGLDGEAEEDFGVGLFV